MGGLSRRAECMIKTTVIIFPLLQIFVVIPAWIGTLTQSSDWANYSSTMRIHSANIQSSLTSLFTTINALSTREASESRTYHVTTEGSLSTTVTTELVIPPESRCILSKRRITHNYGKFPV